MGAVIVRNGIYDGDDGRRAARIRSSCSTATPTPDIRWRAPRRWRRSTLFEEEQLFERAGELAPYFEDAVHCLRELPHVIDVRNMGMVAGIELEPMPGKPTARAFDAFQRCYEKGVLIRTTGDIIALSPPLIISKPQIDELVGTLGGVLREMGRSVRRAGRQAAHLNALHLALAELHQAVVDPFGGELLLHRVLPQPLLERRPVHAVERLVLVEAGEHIARRRPSADPRAAAGTARRSPSSCTASAS